MGNITANETVTFDGVVSVDAGDETIPWGGGKYISYAGIFATSGTDLAVTVNLAGTQWGVGTLNIDSDSGASIGSVTLNDSSTGEAENDEGVGFDHIVINATTSTNLTFAKASFDKLELWGTAADTITVGTGYYQWLTTGRGSDIVTIGVGGLGTGVGKLDTGDDDDTVNIDAGYSDSIATEDGNDIVNVTDGDVNYLNTAEGNDTVTFSGIGGATAVEVEGGNNAIVLSFTDDNSGVHFLRAGDGDDTLTATATGSGFLRYAHLGDGNNVVNSNIEIGTLIAGGDSNITIGAGGYAEMVHLFDGTNSFTISGIGDNDGEYADASAVKMGDGDDTVVVGDYANIDSLQVGGGANTITVDGGVESIRGWTGNNNIEINGWVADIALQSDVNVTNSITVNGGGGFETIRLGDNSTTTIVLDSGGGAIRAGAGNETITVNTYVDSINLGSGTNAVTIKGNGVNNGGGGANTIRAYSSNTTLTVEAGAYLESLSLYSDSSMDGQAGSTVNADGFVYSLIMGRANDILNIGLEGVAFADMHRGDDLVTFGDMYDPTWSSMVFGGRGTDTADFSSISGGVTISLATTDFIATNHGTFGLNGFEKLIGTNFNDTLVGAKSTASELRGGAGDDTYVISSSLTVIDETGGSGTDTIESSSISINLGAQNTKLTIENATLTGGFSLSLTGNGLANELVGNSGENVIDGKGGNDTLTGGDGKDTFLFSTTPDDATNVDVITDYDPTQDRIHLDNAAFTAFAGMDNAWMYPVQFTANATGEATARNHHVIYETDTGNLYYDSNGSDADGRVLFAQLDAGLTMTASEFFIV